MELLITVLLSISILVASYIVVATELDEEPQGIEEARNALWTEYVKGELL